MRRTRGSRRRHSGSFAGLRASNRPGSAPRGETAPAPRTRPPTRPRVPARSPPRARPRVSGRFGNRERRTWRRGARHTRARSRDPGLRRAGARAPLQQRTGSGSSGAGDRRRAGAEGVSRGSGLSSAAASQVLLDVSGPSRPLQSCHAAVNTLRFCVEWTL